MDDSWLAHGHGSEPVHLDTIFTSTAHKRPAPLGLASDPTKPASIAGSTRRRSSRLAVVVALWFGIMVGTSGAAWAVRDALFPSIGPAEVSVWQNPGRDTLPASDEDITTVASTTAPTNVVTSTEASTPTSVEAHESNDAPENSTRSSSDDGSTQHGGETTPNTVPADTPTSVDDHGDGGHGGSGSGDTVLDAGSGSGTGSGSGEGSHSGGGSDSGGGSGSGGSSDG